MSKVAKMHDKAYIKLKKYAEAHGLSMVDVLNLAIGKLEVKKMVDKEKDTVMCEECEEDGVPKDASFCPYCGVEFEDEDEDEEEED